MKKILILIFFLIGSLLMGGGWWLSDWSGKRAVALNFQRNLETKKALESLVPALAHYKKAKKTYPASLKALVPGFLSALPGAPKDFCYVGGKRDYHLYFCSFDNGLGQNLRFYSPKENRWYEMDALDCPREILEKSEIIRAK